jgi:hypothetical protein
LYFRHRAILGKHLPQLFFGRRECHVAHIEICSHSREPSETQLGL